VSDLSETVTSRNQYNIRLSIVKLILSYFQRVRSNNAYIFLRNSLKSVVCNPKRKVADMALSLLKWLFQLSELRLFETVAFPSERLPSVGKPRLHGSVQSRPHHDNVRAETRDEETRPGREGIQGEFTARNC